jgi:hypothetical protein
MKRLDCNCHALLKSHPLNTPTAAHFPHEESVSRFAKRVRSHPVGEFTLGHYHLNPSERPDSVLKSQYRHYSAVQGDHDILSVAVVAVTTEELDRWPDRDAAGGSDHLVALADAAGKLLLFDCYTQAGAEQVMEKAARATTEWTTAQGRNPLSPESGEFIAGYPLTKEELRLLAIHWATLHIDNAAWCVLAATVGTTELGVADYTGTRLDLIAGILGDEAIEAAYFAAEERIRERLGDELWTAFRERKPVLRERMDADQMATTESETEGS